MKQNTISKRGEESMPFEKGGRADKQGNKYEKDCIIYEMIKVLNERNYSVVIEPLGMNEVGTDILVTTSDGKKEHQQCKARNSSKEHWDASDLKARNIFRVWKFQLDRDEERKVALVSPMVCTNLEDLCKRAKNTSGKAEDFNQQIFNSGKEFIKFYEAFCSEMELDKNNETDVLRATDYLKRISYKQISEYEINERIHQNIQYWFCNEFDEVYNAMISLIESKDILGKEITQTILLDYFTKQNITMKMKAGDKRLAPRIQEINEEYKDTFVPLQDGLIQREEFATCIEAIESEEMVIVSGNAGCGKSGCMEAILNYCEKNSIPYVAIKLDRRIPRKNCDAWGRELGFPGSIVHAIHYLSKNEKAVIILDQLDALRWTQANSSEALTVCMELIRQVKQLNYERKKKMIIVFACRTYDLENDNNIKQLFENKNLQKDEWKIVKVNTFSDDMVKLVIGDNYDSLTSKLKKVLKIPSNLYIWQHLDKKENYNSCSTTSHLIEKWLEQLCRKCVSAGLEEKNIKEIQSRLVNTLDKRGCLYIPKQVLNAEQAGLDYLISSGIIVNQNNKIGFVHQSILDCLISQNMMTKYFEEQPIESIIGEKSKQDPARRYQVQMFLQNILEYESNDFIQIGEKMLASDNIRYYVKYLFYEILGQIQEPDESVAQFIIDNCENPIYGAYLVNNTIFGHKQYINILRDKGILESWYLATQEKRTTVFRLLQSIAPDLEEKDVSFIEKHVFRDKNDDENFLRCFLRGIEQDSDEMFELRMKFYKHYPEYAKETYIDVKKMEGRLTRRIIRMISFGLQNETENFENYAAELMHIKDSFEVGDAEFILKELLPYVPKERAWEIKYSNWSEMSSPKINLERVSVNLVKRANKILINTLPDTFWQIYEPYMGKGYYIFNEIILNGLVQLPSQYSNRVIYYLSKDLDKNLFDYTSGEDDQLKFTKEILRKHADLCDRDAFLTIEDKIYRYIAPNAIERYKRRIEINKEKEDEPIYWSFWGELQHELLPCLPKEKTSKQVKALVDVLERRFNKEKLYSNLNGHSGWVKSPISGKNIGKNQWYKIITNEKLKTKRSSIEVEGGFIESSYRMYIGEFELAVRNRTLEMIQLVLENKDRVFPEFIDAMFSGIEMSETLKDIEPNIIEKILLVFPCDKRRERAIYFCRIIEKLDDVKWSSDILKQLTKFALDEYALEEKTSIVKTKDKDEETCKGLNSKVYSSVRGSALKAMGQLLWKNTTLFSGFKNIIEIVIKDENLTVKFAALCVIWPAYNIERDWAKDKLIYLYENDIRMVSFYGSRNMLLILYPQYKKQVIDIVQRCFESEDEILIEIGGYAACEIYMLYTELENIILACDSNSEKQMKAILDMAITYLKVDGYQEKAKNIILAYKNIDKDMNFPLSRIFYDNLVDARQDRLFIKEFIESKAGRRQINAFIRYLEKNAISLIDYADIILELCENILQIKPEELQRQWGIERKVSKLIISLYDETTNSTISGKKIADKCLELWDIMFEKQLGSVREISRKLMER